MGMSMHSQSDVVSNLGPGLKFAMVIMVTFAGNEIEDTCAPLFGKVLAVSPFSFYLQNKKK